MDELLKEAIADAKAVRETALANAKLALEEAFTPRLKSMLSKKIQAEMEDEEGEEDEMSDEMGDEEEAPEEGQYAEDDEDPGDEASEEEPWEDEGEEEAPEDDEEEMEDEALDMEGVIEINGIKYAPVVTEEDEEDEEAGDEEEEDMEESDDFDLEEILRELEADDSVDEAEEPVDEEDEIDEQSTSSGIGKGTGVKQASGSDEEDPGKGKLKESEETDVDESKEEVDEETETVDEDEEVDESKDEVDEAAEKVEESEDIDLEEVLKALSEDDDDSTPKVETLQAELQEHRKVVKYLREKLNEVNLLNAKLLFTNKLFKAHGLSNEQKMKVVETFDRAKNIREIKLVYATMSESFAGSINKPIKESKGSASKAVTSTKSKKQEIISEGDDMRNRFKKLANIL